jgi:hypothetical protein
LIAVCSRFLVAGPRDPGTADHEAGWLARDRARADLDLRAVAIEEFKKRKQNQSIYARNEANESVDEQNEAENKGRKSGKRMLMVRQGDRPGA